MELVGTERVQLCVYRSEHYSTGREVQQTIRIPCMQKSRFDSLAPGHVRSQCHLLSSRYHIPYTFAERQAGSEKFGIQCEVLQKPFNGRLRYSIHHQRTKPRMAASARKVTITELRRDEKDEGEGTSGVGIGGCFAALLAPLLAVPRCRTDDISLNAALQ